MLRRTARRRRADEGFTLIEVIVALMVLSIILTASIAFVIRANTASAYQQHNQVAITIAGQAMERVIATTPTTANLLADRRQTLVNAAWTTNATRGGVAQTYPLWDAAASPTATPRIPITQTQTFSGTVYTATTLIGACYRLRSDLTDVECGKITGVTSAPATPPAGYLRLIRTLVIVTWNADDECPGGCSYQTASYIDTGSDLEWVG
jgi:prepilin-type N-terminal cleavage/methylation domain-containing protein